MLPYTQHHAEKIVAPEDKHISILTQQQNSFMHVQYVAV